MPFGDLLRGRWNIIATKELRDQSKNCFQKANRKVIDYETKKIPYQKNKD